MTKRKRRKIRFKIAKFRKKLRPREVNLLFKENVSWQSLNLKEYLRVDNILENETLALLEDNVKKGIIKTEDKDLYLAFWREVREKCLLFSEDTLEKEINNLVYEYELRGLKKEKLIELVELAIEQSKRIKLFEKEKQFQYLIDYLKFKVFLIFPNMFNLQLPVSCIFIPPEFYRFTNRLPLRLLRFSATIRKVDYVNVVKTQLSVFKPNVNSVQLPINLSLSITIR